MPRRPFPFVPYPEQERLMCALDDCLQHSRSGCFESPTGTGKSLSAVFSCLSWILDQEELIEQELVNQAQANIQAKESGKTNTAVVDDEDDWLNDMLQAPAAAEKTPNEELKLKKFQEMKKRIASKSSGNSGSGGLNGKTTFSLSSRNSSSSGAVSSPAGNTQKSKEIGKEGGDNATAAAPAANEDDDQFNLPMYQSDDEKKRKAGATGDDDDDFSDEDDEDEDERKQTSEADNYDKLFPKLFYCSRTHTQISQFVGEIKKSCFHSMRVVSLGSRKNMCINERLEGLTEATITEECTNMQKQKTPKTKEETPMKRSRKATTTTTTPTASEMSCPYHRASAEANFSDHILHDVKDLEDIVTKGKSLKSCPYYATRKSIKNAQVVCLPYNMLLSADIRETLKIDVANSIVLIDEAHNLIETINQVNSSEVFEADLHCCFEALQLYLKRFKMKLSGKNLYYLHLLQSVTSELLRMLPNSNTTSTPPTTTTTTTTPPIAILSTNDFLFQANLDNINFVKLVRHMENTNVVNRLSGFVQHYYHTNPTAVPPHRHSGPRSHHEENKSMTSVSISYENVFKTSFRHLLELMKCLLNGNKDGQILLKAMPVDDKANKPSTDSTTTPSKTATAETTIKSIQFSLLNPSVYFNDIVHKAHSVILLGGTLQPFHYVTSQLFPTVDSNKLQMFACDHIVPATSVCAVINSTSPNGLTLEITHQNKYNKDMVQELFLSIFETVKVIPKGVVVFFTSYAYMHFLLEQWQRQGNMQRLQEVKKWFVEPKLASESEKVWNEYGQQIESTNKNNQGGAVLFCVIGGKLSEGINFSDNLARGVVVVGLPYPDPRDPVLQMKLNYANTLRTGSSTELYESMCMKAVNQSIGRAVRHINDFAAIVLLDARYKKPKTLPLLPHWISRSLTVCDDFNESRRRVQQFFTTKQT